MKKRKADKDERGLWKRASQQVVGQIFFPDISAVDTYKLRLTEVCTMPPIFHCLLHMITITSMPHTCFCHTHAPLRVCVCDF